MPYLASSLSFALHPSSICIGNEEVLQFALIYLSNILYIYQCK